MIYLATKFSIDFNHLVFLFSILIVILILIIVVTAAAVVVVADLISLVFLYKRRRHLSQWRRRTFKNKIQHLLIEKCHPRCDSPLMRRNVILAVKRSASVPTLYPTWSLLSEKFIFLILSVISVPAAFVAVGHIWAGQLQSDATEVQIVN